MAKITIEEAQGIIREGDLTQSAKKVIAAHTLMETCEHDMQVTLQDMLRCLDYGGSIAAVGARCLYVRTGRDGIGWRYDDSGITSFVIDRADWEEYLREHQHIPEKREPNQTTTANDLHAE